MPPMPPDERPPHLVSVDGVAAWLLDSVNGRVTYHNTTPLSAAEIRRRGVNIDRSRLGAFGQGFYSSTEPEPFYGPVAIRVAIRLRHPLVGHLDDVEANLDDLMDRLSLGRPEMTPTMSRRIRRELLNTGYDGLVV